MHFVSIMNFVNKKLCSLGLLSLLGFSVITFVPKTAQADTEQMQNRSCNYWYDDLDHRAEIRAKEVINVMRQFSPSPKVDNYFRALEDTGVFTAAAQHKQLIVQAHNTRSAAERHKLMTLAYLMKSNINEMTYSLLDGKDYSRSELFEGGSSFSPKAVTLCTPGVYLRHLNFIRVRVASEASVCTRIDLLSKKLSYEINIFNAALNVYNGDHFGIRQADLGFDILPSDAIKDPNVLAKIKASFKKTYKKALLPEECRRVM